MERFLLVFAHQVAGAALDAGGAILTSGNGQSWSSRSTSQRHRDIICGGSIFVAVGVTAPFLLLHKLISIS